MPSNLDLHQGWLQHVKNQILVPFQPWFAPQSVRLENFAGAHRGQDWLNRDAESFTGRGGLKELASCFHTVIDPFSVLLKQNPTFVEATQGYM